jgi:two-component system nitrogen regulation sensor histidine kinase GlnL
MMNTETSLSTLDLLVTPVALVRSDGSFVFVNTAFEGVVSLSRRALMRTTMFDWMSHPEVLKTGMQGILQNEFSTRRQEVQLKRLQGEPVRMDLILTEMVTPAKADQGLFVLEMVEMEQQVRQEREERLLDQARANKELIRNLAHEIKNPLGGIRGAAQLLQMELDSRDLSEYTQVIIHEADRLQTLVDRLLAPHRRPHVVGDVNMHEVCERVRALIMAEYPRGLKVVRDYDLSIPEFRGDKEQLIQAVLNIAHNATQALSERIAAGDAQIIFKTRVARQVTWDKQRYRLALELHIQDNGPGIPEAIKDRIFYPLVSGTEGGSGLGLTLAQTFIQQHMGMIECESQAGRTDFKIMIPLP